MLSRKLINYHKSIKVFSSRVSEDINDKIKRWMLINVTINIGKSKRYEFNYNLDTIRNKLNGWKENHLSYARKNTLIKTVTQAIPTYTMSVFILPNIFCKHIDRITCNYFRGIIRMKGRLVGRVGRPYVKKRV